MLAEHERFNLDQLTKFERFILEFTATTVPHSHQKDYIEHYSCKPPPLLMIIVSLIEVLYIHSSHPELSSDILHVTDLSHNSV